MKGKLIVCEGIDGAGKSGHIPALRAMLEGMGHTVVVTREPGGTELAEKLRAILLHTEMSALTETLLMSAARRDHIENVIAPALERGEVVLCDRFTDSTYAYQCGGKGLDWNAARMLERLVTTTETREISPDLVLWFDLDPAIALQRLNAARPPDKFESSGLAFFQRVAAAYKFRSDFGTDRFVRIDAEFSPDEVWDQVQKAVADRIAHFGWTETA